MAPAIEDYSGQETRCQAAGHLSFESSLKRFDCTVEAWDRANWWTDRQLSSTAAAKILRKRLEVYGPQSEVLS